MSDNSAAIGLASASSPLAAAEQFGLALGDERPGDGFGEAARGQRALGLAGAVLDRREHGFACMRAARERRRRHAVDADDAHQFLDDVGAAMHVRPPRRHRDFHAVALAGGEEAELLQHAAHVGERQLDASQPL